ncbi:hypothetical protein AC579_6207 [Pseudocercospora musae]|uniref:Eukaryotic translation initiation factor 3 subunit J n=1 Tax=Pseudocercospora musae TaxID=113226 RepID=A0A139ICI8_9PEZI|nr:hypothetical protein AC579_6207 [Pseudocercospora musae]
MAPSKTSWDDEESDSTPPSSPPVAPVARRGKFDDEEEEDVLESWDAAEDSEEEREKAKKAAEAKAKADAAAKASHKSKAQRMEEKREERLRERALLEDDESESEDESDRRARMRAAEMDSDLKNAEDLFGGGGTGPNRKGTNKAITVQATTGDPTSAVDLSSLSLFNPKTVQDFNKMRDTLVPLLNNNAKKPQYESFVKEFTKQIVKEMNSEQIKKVASALTAVSNEKLKEEKAAEKGGKKTKAAKTKASLNANRDVAYRADTAAYDDDGLDEGDFM